MAEERNVATVRAADTITTDDETTKEELQRRMEEARESITQTVAEIKDTVSTQYQTVKESINEALDWREQYRKRPVAFNIGALSVGFFVGYGIAAAASGDRSDRDDNVFDVSEREDYEDYEEKVPFYQTYQSGRNIVPAAASVYSSQAVTEAPVEEAAAGPPQPGLFERFKETRAFDRLQQEVSSLGDRLVDELSQTAQVVVLPALLGKLKDMIGLDLSTQQKEAERSSLEHKAAEARNDAINAKA